MKTKTTEAVEGILKNVCIDYTHRWRHGIVSPNHKMLEDYISDIEKLFQPSPIKSEELRQRFYSDRYGKITTPRSTFDWFLPYLKTNLEEDTKFIKETTGFDTNAEFSAYQKGREDEQEVVFKWIENWDGSTNSAMGDLLSKKCKSESKIVSDEEILKQAMIDCKHSGELFTERGAQDTVTAFDNYIRAAKWMRSQLQSSGNKAME